MALSQLQCLDDNNVNPRSHESKPEFFYCEGQRLALEALLRGGREAFGAFLEARGLRGFLSEPELEALRGAAEPYDPASDLYQADGDDENEPPLSLHYWPDLSDASLPRLDLGWPDCAAYRGVTRTNVYAQPPLDGHGHLKEIVRKTIAQAQKVIAVVMDVFTDVDIFRDLLEVSLKKKVSVYILLERTALPHFLSMCERANMHPGYLKNLRVRCAGGGDFYTRSCTRIRGRLGHRFMFVDGDKAVSGSYSYTWMSSRLDRHLITVITGQAVDAFDRLFRDLYMISSAVDLRQVAMEPEPEPEPLPEPAPVAPPSAAIARKMYSAKYALLTMSTSNTSPASSSGHNSPKDSTSQDTTVVAGSRKGKRKRAKKEAIIEAPPTHPGLASLEKAYLIPYLPTWPEPDPPSDVIGFINVRDTSRQMQVHLQRSERFETSQAIKFKSPISMPKETLPEVAQPRQLTAKHQDNILHKAQPTQVNNKPVETVVVNAQTGHPHSGPSCLERDVKQTDKKAQSSSPGTDTATKTLIYTHTPQSAPKSETKTHAVITELNRSTNTPAKQNTTPQVEAPTPTSNNMSIVKAGSAVPTHCSHNVAPMNTKQEQVSVPKNAPDGRTTPNFNNDTKAMLDTGLPADCMQTANQINQQNTGAHSQVRPKLVSKDLSLNPQVQSPSKYNATTSIPIPSLPNCISASSASHPHPPAGLFNAPSDKTSSATTTNPTNCTPTMSSSYAISPSSSYAPPVPKPRTVHLPVDSSSRSSVSDQPENRMISSTQNVDSTGPPADHVETDQLTRQREIGKMSRKPGEGCSVAQQTQDGTPSEKEGILKTVTGRWICSKSKTITHTAIGMEQQPQSAIWTPNTLQAGGVHFEEMAPKQFEGNTVTLTDMYSTPKPQSDKKQPADLVILIRDCESSSRTDEESENFTQTEQQLAIGTEPKPLSLLQPPKTRKHIVIDTLVHEQNSDGSQPSHIADNNLHVRGQRGVGPTLGANEEAIGQTQYVSNSARYNAKGGSHAPDGELRQLLPASPANMGELRFRAPTPDRLPSRTPTPDSRCCTPDFRTPPFDVSDDYSSPLEDSTLSTTSDEYYECSESPSQESVFDRGAGPGSRQPTDEYFFAFTSHDFTRTARGTDTNTTALSPSSIKGASYNIPKSGFTDSLRGKTPSPPGASTNARVYSSSLAQNRSHTKQKSGREEEEGGRENRATGFVAGQTSKTGSDTRLPQKGTNAGLLPLEVTKAAEEFEALMSEAIMSVGVKEALSPPSPQERKRSSTSSSTASSGKATTSHLATPVPSPVPSLVPRGAAPPEEPLQLLDGNSRRPSTFASGVRQAEGAERRHPGCESSPVTHAELRVREEPEKTSAKRPKAEDLSEPGESTRKGAGERRSCELKPTAFSTEEENLTQLPCTGKSPKGSYSDGDTTIALVPSGVEKREGPQAAREAEGKKLPRTPPRAPRGIQQQQQQDSRVAFQSRPSRVSRPPRPYPSPAQPPKIDQAGGGRVAHGGPHAQDIGVSTPSRPPPRQSLPVPAAGPAGGARRRPLEDSPSLCGFPYGQGKAKARPTQGQPLYPKAPFLHTQANLQSALQPQSVVSQAATQAQANARQGSAASDKAPGQEHSKVSFGFSLGKLYNLKGIKDKVDDTPAQSRRRSTISPSQGIKRDLN